MQTHKTSLQYAALSMHGGSFGPATAGLILRRVFDHAVQHQDAGSPLWEEPTNTELIETVKGAMADIETLKKSWSEAETKINKALAIVREESQRERNAAAA